MVKDAGNKIKNFGCIRQDYLDFQDTFLGTPVEHPERGPGSTGQADFADVTDSILTCCCSKNLGA